MTHERLLRADLHTHTNFSKDGITPPNVFVTELLRQSIGIVAITDHDTMDGIPPIQDAILSQSAGITVISGIEITTGTPNQNDKNIELLAYYLSEPVSSGLNLSQTIQEVAKQKGIISIPHPFELWRHGAGEEVEAIIAYATEAGVPVAIEIFNARALPGFNKRSENSLARFQNTIYTAGSDGHHPLELGRAGLLLVVPSNEVYDKNWLLLNLRNKPQVFGEANPLTTFILRLLVKFEKKRQAKMKPLP
ncbi:PHP domain-containing protein [Candidatus Beckwithbacteria bacterium]|nr:PHP domain-containing protein [Candidatus Beckwithbacteria bacterium]